MKYVSWDYEETGVDNYWHVYSSDQDGGTLLLDESAVLIKAPHTPEMRAAIVKIAEAIDAAVELAESYGG